MERSIEQIFNDFFVPVLVVPVRDCPKSLKYPEKLRI